MAVAFDKATRQSGTSTSPSVGHNPVGVPTIVFMDLSFFSGVATISGTPTYGGVNMTDTGAGLIRNSTASIYNYKLENPPSGSQTLSATLSASSSWAIVAVTYTGSATSSATGTPVSNTGTTSVSVTVSSGTGHMVHDMVLVTSAGSPTLAVSGSNVQSYNATFGGISRDAGSRTTGASPNVTASWTVGGTSPTAAQIGVDILPPAVAAALKRNANLDGLSASGGFFGDPLGAAVAAARHISFARRGALWLPRDMRVST